MADSQIVYTEMVAERKTEESIPCGSKKHRGYTEKNIPPPLRACCVGVCLRVCLPLACVSLLTPLASTAACRRPGKGRCAQSRFQGYALGYALGMLWVCFLASIQLYTLWVRSIHPSTDPEAYPLSIPRSGPRKHSMLSWRSVGYVFAHVTPMCFRLIGYGFSIRTQNCTLLCF